MKKAKIKKIFIIMMVMFLLFIITGENTIIREDWVVIKKTAPSEIKVDEILNVNIEVWNYYNESINILLREIVNFGEPLDKENIVQEQNFTETDNGTIINEVRWLINPDGSTDGKCEVLCNSNDKICDPDCKCTFGEDKDCGIFVPPISPTYEWEFILEPNSKKTISYKVKPFYIGKIEIPRTVAETKIGTFYSNSLTVTIKCNSNRICERNENYYNCPEDCTSGSRDGYCDKVIDGICDADCLSEQDLDCLPLICGDKKCDSLRGEDYENCPQDCKKPIICGDNFCDENENFGNCKEDCPSGRKDNFCDALKDGKCDPDCKRELDEDCFCNNDKKCEEKFENFINCPEDCPKEKKVEGLDTLLLLLFIIGIIIFLVTLLYIYRKKQHHG